MSELKSFIVLYDGKFIRAYKESEADKVIAEKDAQIASLNGEIAKMQDKMFEDVFEGIMPSEHIVCRPLQQAAQRIAELKESVAVYQRDEKIDIRELRHQKYKRCLAMAKWCKTSALCDEGLGAFKYRDWYRKWFKRWIKLAEKFKDKEAK